MKKSIVLFIMGMLLATNFAFSQILSQVTVKDQFDSGERGGNLNLTNLPTGIGEYYSFETISNTNGVTGTIVYKNAFAGQLSKPSVEVESPVLGVLTTNLSPDRSFNLNAIPANTRPGATSPSSVVYVGDDGGYNTLALGNASSDNYFLQTDMYCPDYSAVAGAGAGNFTRMGIAIRANYDVVPSIEGPSINEYPWGSYGLMYESSITTLFAVKFTQETTVGAGDMRHISLATPTTMAQIIATKPISGGGWHTLKICAYGSIIQFFVDGVQLGLNFGDSAYPRGEAVLFYRASNGFDGVAATDTQAQFDNLIAGPFSIPVSVTYREWQLFD